MKKSIWVLCFIGFGSVFVLGGIMAIGGLSHYSSAPGISENLELKDRIATLWEPTEAVVAIDRSLEGPAILVRLVYEDDEAPWSSDAEREALADEIGRFAWKNYPSSPARELERVTVVFQVIEGMGCSGPVEVLRKEVARPDPPGKTRGTRRGRGDGQPEK